MMMKLTDVAIWVRPDADNVAVAKAPIAAGTELEVNGRLLRVRGAVTAGHRLAVARIPAGRWALQYGQPFGVSRGILPGDPITARNLVNRVPRLDAGKIQVGQFADLSPLRIEPAPTFAGFRRADGRVGTRNWVLVLPTSICSSHEAQMISMKAELSGLWSREKYPNVDGVTALPHTRGCGCTDGGQVTTAARVLARYLNHPNVAAALVIELGCEKTNLAMFQNFADRHLDDTQRFGTEELAKLNAAPRKAATEIFGKPVRTLSVQAGGTETTIQRGLELLPELLAEADKCRREPAPVSELTLGLKCGGSDAFSGLSANPALGHANDILIANGGSSLITEVSEFEGAAHLYAARCRTRAAAREIVSAVKRFDAYLRKASDGGSGDNPSPGNKAGGLINITVKSLGAMAKSGRAPVEGIVGYGQLPPHKGHWLLYGPAYDPVSVSAEVASGCQVVVFTTGRGTALGNAIAPVLKIASNSGLAARMAGDIDLNAGVVIDGTAGIEQVGRQLFDLVVATAGGQWCRAEHNKHREFMIWDEEGVTL